MRESDRLEREAEKAYNAYDDGGGNEKWAIVTMLWLVCQILIAILRRLSNEKA